VPASRLLVKVTVSDDPDLCSMILAEAPRKMEAPSLLTVLKVGLPGASLRNLKPEDPGNEPPFTPGPFRVLISFGEKDGGKH
jgi:hypothetical protein